MRKILLLLSLFLCSLVAVAQANFTVDVKKQRTDNMMEFTFHYNGVNENATFEVFKYENGAKPEKPSIKFSTLERLPDGVEEENFYKMEDGNFVLDPNTKQLICIYEFTGNESYSCYLDGLDLTGSTFYQIAIKVTTKDENDQLKEETIFIREANGQFTGNATPVASQNDATKYKFKYGLPDIPVLSDGKSTSVKLSWTSNCLFPEPGTKPDFYTIYGHKTENGEITHYNVATTTDTEYLITHLVPSVEYEFFVRAYKDGVYLSTSPYSDIYVPVRTECLTFTDITISKDKKTITLNILEFGNGFDDNKGSYELSNGTQSVKCSTIDTGTGTLTFKFNNAVDYTKEFRLETTIKKQDEGEVKAVGVFELDNEGKLSTQHCDIEIGLEVTKTTQYVAELSWNNPGFDVKTAILEVINLDKNDPKSIKLENPSVTKFSVGNLEHSTNYKFVLTLEDDGGYNTTKDEVITKTKVGSICGLEGVTSASSLGCGGNGFLAPYDVEFYTEYENDKPKVTVRFKLNSDDEINSVKLYYAPDGDFFTTLLNIKSLDMKKMSDGWYSASFDKLSGVNNMDGRRFYFSVAVTPAKRCNWALNFYLTKSVAYQVGTGCQDEEVYKIIEFEKTYNAQSQLTLQTTGSMASVGVFPESGYNKTTGEFDLKQRLYYNNFDDAPSKFTLDISKYAVGKYYMHIHDVYGEADGLKYLWAIY